MIETNRLLNRIAGIGIAALFVFGLLFLNSCGDDGDDPVPELYDLSGFYTFKEATLVDGADGIAAALGFPASFIPSDITEAMAGGLLAEAPCDDSSNGAVELRSDKKLYYACLTETNAKDAGTWSVNIDTTELNLNLAVPQPLQLKIADLAIDEANDVIGGTIGNFPINKTLLAGFLDPLVNSGAINEDTKNTILSNVAENFSTLITVDIDFQKVE